MARRLGIALLLSLTALLPTWPFVFGNQVPAPVDWVHHAPPWNGAEPDSAYDILAMDGALQFLPWRDYMLASYRAGHVPLWNADSLGGAPFLANSQSAPIYPLHWLWPFDAESLLGFSAWLHLVIAGLGVYALCRRLGAMVVGGLVAGISVQLSAFFISWIALPSVVMTAAWIPWCLWAVLWVASVPLPSLEGIRGGLAVDGAGDQPPPNLPQAWGRDLARPIAAVGACVGMMLLAGHLQIAAYGLLVVVAFVLWLVAFPLCDRSDKSARADKGSRWRALWAIAGIALGFAIAAPQLLPAIEHGRQGHRAGAATAEGWEAYRASAATPLELVTLVSPDFFGTPQPRNRETGMTSYWLAYEKPGRHFAEIAFYVGPVVLPLAAFALVGIRRRPQVGFFVVLALLGLLIALGTPVAQALYFGLPGWSATGSPARAAVLVTIGLCVLAGMGLRVPAMQGSSSDRTAPMGAAIAQARPVFAVFFAALAFYLFSKWTISDEVRDIFDTASPGAIYALGLAAALVVATATTKRSLGPLLAAMAILGFVFLRNIIPASPAGQYAENFPGMEALQKAGRIAVIGDDWPFLTTPTKTIAPPNSLLPYGIKTVGGYDSIISAAYKRRLDDANVGDSAPPANGNMLFVKPSADLAKLRNIGADTLMASTQFPYDLPVLFDGGNWRLYQLTGDDPQPFLYHEIYNHKKLLWKGELREQSRRWLESPEADGWEMNSATFDFREKTVLAIYRPHSYRVGLLLAMLGGAATIALCFGGGTRRAQN